MVSDAVIVCIITTIPVIITALTARANPSQIKDDNPANPACTSSPECETPVSSPEDQVVVSLPSKRRCILARTLLDTTNTSGPWPINCGAQKKEFPSIRTRAEAERIARAEIEDDSKNNIVEVVDGVKWVGFGWAWTISVKTFSALNCPPTQETDVKIGSGKRYVAWDATNFKHKNKVTATLIKEGFEIKVDNYE